MSRYVAVAKLDEVPAGASKTVVIGEREIALFNVGGTYYAIDNFCPHQGGPLADGWLEGTTVTCPWHAWCFDLRDGKMTLGDFASVERFDVQVEGSTIMVSLEPVL